MTDKKLRVLHVIVQPVLVYDDGQELTEGPQTRPTAVSLSALARMEETILSEVATFEAQKLRDADGMSAHP